MHNVGKTNLLNYIDALTQSQTSHVGLTLFHTKWLALEGINAYEKRPLDSSIIQ
jgi:hypothetical protein